MGVEKFSFVPGRNWNTLLVVIVSVVWVLMTIGIGQASFFVTAAGSSFEDAIKWRSLLVMLLGTKAVGAACIAIAVDVFFVAALADKGASSGKSSLSLGWILVWVVLAAALTFASIALRDTGPYWAVAALLTIVGLRFATYRTVPVGI